MIQVKEEAGEKDLSTHKQTFPKGVSRQIVHTPVLCVALRGSVVNGMWTGTEEGVLSSLLWCPPQLHRVLPIQLGASHSIAVGLSFFGCKVETVIGYIS